jgi:hypothetical protein
MSDWDNLVEPTRGALEALLRKGDAMADRIEELEAKLSQQDDLVQAAVERGLLAGQVMRRIEG